MPMHIGPLQWAAERGLADTVQTLLQAKARADQVEMRSIRRKCSKSHAQLAPRILTLLEEALGAGRTRKRKQSSS